MSCVAADVSNQPGEFDCRLWSHNLLALVIVQIGRVPKARAASDWRRRCEESACRASCSTTLRTRHQSHLRVVSIRPNVVHLFDDGGCHLTSLLWPSRIACVHQRANALLIAPVIEHFLTQARYRSGNWSRPLQQVLAESLILVQLIRISGRRSEDGDHAASITVPIDTEVSVEALELKACLSPTECNSVSVLVRSLPLHIEKYM